MAVGLAAFIYDLALDKFLGYARSAAEAHYGVVLVEILRSLCDLGEKREER